MTDSSIIEHTNNWIKSVVIGLNFCPFAAKAVIQNTIHYSVLQTATLPSALEELEKQLLLLDTDAKLETTLIIFPNDFENFQSYLDLVKKAERLLSKLNYDGVYQIASFHPEYCFANTDENDPSNYTNRSVYPMLHLLREESITKALSTFKNPEMIPERNIDLAREKGLKYMQVLRAACFGS